MDLSSYVSELLKQHGKLCVPGLGYFTQQRKSSYYDQATSIINPPYFETTFELNEASDSDDTLITYIAQKKNISLESARYFLEKYISSIKDRAAVGAFEFDSLGAFYLDESAQLAFRPAKTDPATSAQLFGLPRVAIRKLADMSIPLVPNPPLAAAPVNNSKTAPRENFSDEGRVMIPNASQLAAQNQVEEVPVYIWPAPILQASTDERYATAPANDEEEGLSSNGSLVYWIIISVLVIAAIGALLTYYKLHDAKITGKAATVQKSKNTVPATVSKIDTAAAKRDSVTDTIPPLGAAPVTGPDSTNKNAAQTAVNEQTVANQPVETINTSGEIPKDAWLIVAGQYYDYQKAKNRLAMYRKLGFSQTRLLDSLPKKEYYLYKIIFGYRNTQKEANDARTEILKSRKLKPKFVTIQPNK